MGYVKKDYGKWVCGSLTILEDLVVGDSVDIDGDITIGGAFEITGNLTADGTLIALDGSTSARLISAGFTSLESPANRFGVSPTIYMQVATTAASGITAITHTGTAPAVTWTADSLSFVGNFDSNGATAVLDGSTSVRLLSAGFVSTEAPDIRFGYDASDYMKIAVATGTGDVAITHTGTNKSVTWTAAAGFDFVGAIALDAITAVGNLSVDGTTALIDGATSVRLVSAGFASLESPSVRFGFSDSIYTSFAVADTTGNLTITHVGGSTDLVTWTAGGGFSLVGAIAVTGTLGVSGTLSAGLDATAGMFELYPGTTNTGTTTVTMADNSGDTVTNINVALQAGARTYTIPDAGASAAFLMTDSYKTIWSFSVGLAGEDTDGVFTNSGGIAGAVPDSATNQYNNAGGTVSVKVYDHGTTTWDDLATSATLTGWTANYQLLPDAASEEALDAFAVGFATKFCEFGFNDLQTGTGAFATWATDGGKYQYSIGAGTWSDLTVFDNTDSVAQDGLQSLVRIGVISFAPPSDWVAATYDGQEAYWVQYVLTGAQLTQTPLIDSVAMDEPFVIVAGADSFDAPFKATIGEVRVTDMGVTVHNQIIKFVVCNFTTSSFTEEFSWTASQYNDTFIPATPLAVAADDLIGILITDDTASTVNPVLYVELEATYLD